MKNNRQLKLKKIQEERWHPVVTQVVYLEILVAEVLRRHEPEVEISDVAGVIEGRSLVSMATSAMGAHLVDPCQIEALEFASHAFSEFRQKYVLNCPEDARINGLLSIFSLATAKMKEAFAIGKVTI